LLRLQSPSWHAWRVFWPTNWALNYGTFWTWIGGIALFLFTPLITLRYVGGPRATAVLSDLFICV
jgi:hypothetical protein